MPAAFIETKSGCAVARRRICPGKHNFAVWQRDVSKIEWQGYLRRAGGGRKPKDPRLVFEGIVYVLRTSYQWKALPPERYGSASAIHARFLEWEKAGFFEALWKAGLAEYDDVEGIAWRWQSIDGAMTKAPTAQETVGPNPTDRGKKWNQKASSRGRAWTPVVNRRNRRESA